ncbi:MAG: peptidoglycan editing factor PgeF [Duodenibacillus sp.]|nr:peptidoglycan editing factor PgeF [Duodenibacillus sp.]
MALYKEELETLRPESLGSKVEALFTLRLGGVSSGPWGAHGGVNGLNVGAAVGDNEGCVRMNRQIVAGLAPQEPRWMTQVHGVRVVDAEAVDGESVEADAQVSVTPGVVCAIQVADCLPVVIADRKGRGLACVHAGWRGLSAGVVEAAVERLRERMGCEGELAAWLGPRIGARDYETSAEVVDRFSERWPDAAGLVHWLPSDTALLDLAGYARLALKSCGVEDIEDCGLSTFADARRFYSYRRDGEQTGRHAMLAWIKEA